MKTKHLRVIGALIAVGLCVGFYVLLSSGIAYTPVGDGAATAPPTPTALPPSNDVVVYREGIPEAWSRDGAELLFSSEYRSRFFRLRMADMSSQPAPPDLLPKTSKTVTCLDWRGGRSPFAMILGEQGNNTAHHREAIYQFDPSTGGLKFLSEAWGCPSTSPDGQSIAFEDEAHHLAVIDKEGTNKRVLVEKNLVASPAWSPDGRRIAFMMYVALPKGSERNSQRDIAIINADGSDLINLTNTPNVSEDSPTWSPDGRYIAYLVDEEKSIEHVRLPLVVYVQDLTSKAVRQLTNQGYSYGLILWSPDGKWIASPRMLTWDRDSRINPWPSDYKYAVVLIPVPEDILHSSTP